MLGWLPAIAVAVPPPVAPLAVADKVLARGLAVSDLGTYPGTLLLQGMSEFGRVSPDQSVLARTIALYQKFPTREIKGRGSFISYEVGGSGAAYLWYHGIADVLAPQVSEAAARMVAQQKRSGEGLLMPPWVVAEKDQVFIDPAFAVTPFLLYAGLAEHRDDYVDLAVFETLELFRILRDKETGLLHQGRGFQGGGVISQDNWSRGNGWGAMAIAALVRDLPTMHPQRKNVEQVATAFFTQVLRFQNEAGLWHQEMTDVTSYTETSGSGLLLYGLGIMLEKGLLDRKHVADVAHGLAGLTAYIAEDGSVSHTCMGCLCPGNGTKDDYKLRAWVYNDPHAFGAVVLAYAQAAKIGISKIKPLLAPGIFADPANAPGKPRTYVRHDPAGSQNISWENDRIAFRLYGPTVRDRVGSGIDVWAKSVEYPIVDKWYRLAAAGQDYHKDRGEGCDFHSVGKQRGCGGTAVWRQGQPYVSQTYATYKIVRNEADGLEFVIEFEPWDAGGVEVSEQKTIRLVSGTNFFEVTSVLRAAGEADLIAAIGITTSGHAPVTSESTPGLLSTWEQLDSKHPALGRAVVVDPAQFAGFASHGSDRYVLAKVKPNQPFTYYVGAGWGGNVRYKAPGAWDKYVAKEGRWEALTTLYGGK